MPRTLLPSVLIIGALLLSACGAAPTASTPTAVPATPTPVPLLPTATAVEATPTALPTPTEPARYLGSLSDAQREALAADAQTYISPYPEDALATVKRMNFTVVAGYATPEAVCGPLSLALLQNAGIVSKDFKLIDFWYLNPRPQHGEKFLQSVFPAEKFEKIEQKLPLNEVDYTANPLYPGDFLYLFAGDSGSFEHMLVVTRVDEEGRAYSVTNINTPYGVVIKEVMLYDPAQPGIGQFYDWTNWENRMLGRTGYGGFWLWRPLAATP